MSDLQQHYYGLIMAGGGGTRLWPLSTQARPKQMLALFDDAQSMFNLTVHRLQPLLPVERVFVVTGQDMVADLQTDTPALPAANFIAEPFGMNSGPAAALGTLIIAEQDPDAIIAMLTADHYIGQIEKYRQVLQVAGSLAAEGYIVTLGITPSHPATGFGYIQRGDLLEVRDGLACYRAATFTEKPVRERAEQFLQTGLYSWNSGMFIWSAGQLLAEIKRQQPAMYDLLMQIRPFIGQPDFTERIQPLWAEMPRLPIDTAVMEGARQMAVIPVDIGWSDIGSWDLLYDVLDTDAQGNVTRGGQHIPLATNNTLVISDRLVATIGVDDLVIVDTPDALLICRRDQAQQVREVVRLLREQQADHYL